MLDKVYDQLKWIIARNELENKKKRGSFLYQRPASDNIFDIHKRVTGLNLGLRGVNLPQTIKWLETLTPNLFEINQFNKNFDTTKLPNIGVHWQEYNCEPMSNTVHTILQWMNTHKQREPVIFDKEFWYYRKIIDKTIHSVEDLQSNNCLVISVPFMNGLKCKKDMNEILKKCVELDIPVALDIIWLPLTNEKIALTNTECIEVITHSITKMLPLAGIKGGFVFWRKPIDDTHNIYPLGNSLSFWIAQEFLEHFDYFHIEKSLRPMQTKWCDLFDIKTHSCCYVGELPKNHWLQKENLYKKKYDEFDGTLFSLIPYYENDQMLTKFLQDKKII